MHDVAFSTLSCPDWSWDEILDQGPRLGYDGVEIRLLERETNLLARPEFQDSRLATRRDELDAAGFRICGLASSVSFDDPDAKRRAAQIETGRRYVDLAAELRAGFVRVFGDTLPHEHGRSRDDALARIAAGMDALGEYAARAGIEILIETHGDFCESSPLRELCERVAQPTVGVLWDTHHPWRFHGESPAITFERIGRWIRHTHWKDSIIRPHREADAASRQAATAAQALMAGHRHADYVPFGGGEFPAEECVRLLLQAGYAGWFCIEWEKMWHPEIEEPEIVLPLFPRKIRRLIEIAGEPSASAESR